MKFDSKNAAEAGKKSSRKGVANKNTAEVRERLKDLINGNMEQLHQDIASLKPKDRVRAIIDLVKIVLPSLKAVELNAKAEVKGSVPIESWLQANNTERYSDND